MRKSGDRGGRKEGKRPCSVRRSTCHAPPKNVAKLQRIQSAKAIFLHALCLAFSIHTRTSVCVSKLQRQSKTRQSPITETKRRVPLSQSNFLPSSVPMSRIFHTHTHICLCVEITKTKNNKTESNHRDQEEGSPQPKQFSSVQCSHVSHFPYTYAHLSVCRNYKDKVTTRQSPITETKRRVPLSPSNFLPSSVPMSRIFHTHTHICLCVEITKTKYNKTESNHRDQEEGSPQPKQFSSVQCSHVSHFPYTYAHLSVCRNYKDKVTTRQSPITETKRRVPLSPSNFLPSSVPLSRIFHTHTHICLCVEITETKYNKTESNHRDQEEGSPQPKQFSSVQCSHVSHFPYTYAHLSVCRNYKEKEQQDRVQSQRPRGGFPSAQAIFFRPVFPCLAFSIHTRTSVCVSKVQRQSTTRQSPITETKRRVPLSPSNFLLSSVTLSRNFHTLLRHQREREEKNSETSRHQREREKKSRQRTRERIV